MDQASDHLQQKYAVKWTRRSASAANNNLHPDSFQNG
jgi:hypothetical protein